MVTITSRADLDALPPELRAKVVAEIRNTARRQDLARSLDHVGVKLHPWQRHLCRPLTSAVRDMLRGHGRNIILQAAPRVGKTFVVGEHLIPWAMRLAAVTPGAPFDGALPTMLVGNEQSLTRRTSGYMQRNYLQWDGLFPTSGRGATWTMDEWTTADDARAIVKGVRGNVTGGGYLLGVADDLLSIGNIGQAAKDHAWTTFRREFLSRRMTGACTILMAHRVALDDVSGRWMELMDEGGIPYEVYTWRMEAEEDEVDHEGNVWRRAGDLLCPELVDETLVKEAKLDDWFWSTTYQQRPTREGGAVIREEWCGHRYHGDPMDMLRLYPHRWVVVDPAAKTKERNDPTAIGVLLWRPGAPLRVAYVEEKRREYPETRQRVKDLSAEWNATAVVVEDTNVGHALVPDLKREGMPAVAVKVAGRGDKVARMTPHLALWESGQVELPHSAPWVRPFVAQMTSVPDAQHDDMWDMMSVGLAYRETVAHAGSIPTGTAAALRRRRGR